VDATTRQRSPGIVFFALGLVAALDDDGPNASLVVAIAGELGLSEAASRTTILRLRRDGMIRSERMGRGARYVASPAIAAAQRRWTEHFSAGPPAWDGVFRGLLHDFSERERARRDALRAAALQVGYGLLRPGLLVSPDDRWPQLAERFASDERRGRIIRIGLTLTDADPRTIARELWPLDALGERYRQLAAQTRAGLAAEPSVGASPIARLHRITQPIYDAVSDDPALPAQLLSDDWPAAELGASLGAAHQLLGPLAVAHAAALRERLRPAA
jgi:phenylacetic acid degradation operon negative regulatory protein